MFTCVIAIHFLLTFTTKRIRLVLVLANGKERH